MAVERRGNRHNNVFPQCAKRNHVAALWMDAFWVCLAIPTTTKTRMQHWLGSSARVPFPTPHIASSLPRPSPPPSPEVLQSCAGACLFTQTRPQHGTAHTTRTTRASGTPCLCRSEWVQGGCLVVSLTSPLPFGKTTTETANIFCARVSTLTPALPFSLSLSLYVSVESAAAAGGELLLWHVTSPSPPANHPQGQEW